MIDARSALDVLTYGVESKPFQVDNKGRGETFVSHKLMRRDKLMALLAPPLVIIVEYFVLKVMHDQVLQLILYFGRLVGRCIRRDVDGDAVEGVVPRTREGAGGAQQHIYGSVTNSRLQE